MRKNDALFTVRVKSLGWTKILVLAFVVAMSFPLVLPNMSSPSALKFAG